MATPEPVVLHLKALQQIERGERAAAASALESLLRDAPDYVPGLLERALQLARQGDRASAAGLMREVLRRTDGRPLDAILAAPEPLPVRFFRELAEAWLRGAHRGSP